jgi:hypothetical protein
MDVHKKVEVDETDARTSKASFQSQRSRDRRMFHILLEFMGKLTPNQPENLVMSRAQLSERFLPSLWTARLQPFPCPFSAFSLSSDYLIAVFSHLILNSLQCRVNRTEDKPFDKKGKQRARHRVRRVRVRVRVRGTERKSERATTRLGGGTASERREGMGRVDGWKGNGSSQLD